MESLSLDEYRSYCQKLPMPTELQRRQYALHLAQAHSWYKKLPLVPPGVSFHFFIDPNAGMSESFLPDGRIEVCERMANGPHYSMLATRSYLSRFGSVRCAGAAPARPAARTVPIRDSECRFRLPPPGPYLYDRTRDAFVGLPAEVLEAGRVELNGLMHSRGARFLGLGLYRDYCQVEVDWPAESGGAARWAEIRVCLEHLARKGSRQWTYDPANAQVRPLAARFGAEPVLCDLVQPERDRQLRAIAAAIERVSRLVAS